MSEIEIVELSPELVPNGAALLAAHLAGWRNLTPAECERHLRSLLDFPGAQLFLARRLGHYGGFVALHWGFSASTGRPILRVQDLFVAPARRRQGIAKALLEYAAALGRSRGANRLQLETDIDNVAARTLYESFGFESFPQKAIYMYFLQVEN